MFIIGDIITDKYNRFYKLEALQETQKRNKSDRLANWKAYTEDGASVYSVAVVR